MVIKYFFKATQMGSSESGTQTQASDSKAHILNHSSLMSVKHHKKSPSYLSAFMFSSTLAKICHPLYMTSLETLTFSKKKKKKKEKSIFFSTQNSTLFSAFRQIFSDQYSAPEVQTNPATISSLCSLQVFCASVQTASVGYILSLDTSRIQFDLMKNKEHQVATLAKTDLTIFMQITWLYTKCDLRGDFSYSYNVYLLIISHLQPKFSCLPKCVWSF